MMTPTRGRPVTDGNGYLKTRQKFIIFSGMVITIFGLATLGFELWRSVRVTRQAPAWRWLLVEVGIIGLGLSLLQTMNPIKVFELAYMLMSKRMPGGRRSTDPPLESAPPHVPREKWPPASADWRIPKRTRDD